MPGKGTIPSGFQLDLIMRTRLLLAAAVSLFALGTARAQLSYSVADLGTLGGNTSTASGLTGQHSQNAAGMIVGSSASTDNTDHGFLWINGRMFDLNALCDLTNSGFKVLTAARSINDSCVIIGEGITVNDQKHAFVMTPLPVDGGQWSYACCQWVWIQDGGGWWWETNCHCYVWHGPPGDHPPCPPKQPHCWWAPLPCPPGCYDCPPPTCWSCINGEIVELSPEESRARGGVCYSSREEAERNCKPRTKCWICFKGEVIEVDTTDARVKEARQCFGSREEALRYCNEKTCWVCINGTPVQLSEAECKQRGGATYRTREEAQRNCQPEQKCWICVNGQAIQLSAAECQQRGGGYASQEEALRNCKQQQTGWCCGPNGIIQATPAQCAQYGGQWFASREEALRACINRRPPTTNIPGIQPQPPPRTSIPNQQPTPPQGRKPRKGSTPAKESTPNPRGFTNDNPNGPRASTPPPQKSGRKSKRGNPTPTPNPNGKQ